MDLFFEPLDVAFFALAECSLHERSVSVCVICVVMRGGGKGEMVQVM